MQLRTLTRPCISSLALTLCACAAPTPPVGPHEQAAAPAQRVPTTVPLYDDLGDHDHAISTRVSLAQRYFDQGLRLVYAFNHAEAIRAFSEAARQDPTCAICHWGIALAYGPNINAPMDAAVATKAYAAIQEAQRLAEHAGATERAYIDALAVRYAAVPLADRSALDAAYSEAMRKVVERYPDDLDAATLYAEALMDLRPWNYWTPAGEPRPGTREILAQLERVLAREPDHPGACHYYIHAVEAAYPERAVPCAERLASLMPGAGHLVHMPAHVYIRVGRYADAIQTTEHAVHADERYIGEQRPEGLYPQLYYPHNYHFLAFAATMAGQSEKAIEAARAVVSHLSPEAARQIYFLEGVPAYVHLLLTRFGRWDEVLREPLPPAELRVATGLAHYARGMAFAAQRQWAKAQAALAQVRQLANEVRKQDPEALNARTLAIAGEALAAEIAARRGRLDEAIRHLREAASLEDSLSYEEPPLWYAPMRHWLGAALLEANRLTQAETAFREDLKRFPENGWSLVGLAESLERQGKIGEAKAVRHRLRQAWAGADVELSAAHF